jgi:DNA-binding response OmpR family regulator
MPMNVLIVETETSIAQSIRAELQRVGHLAAIADDAEQAWALMSVVLPDLILLNRRHCQLAESETARRQV